MSAFGSYTESVEVLRKLQASINGNQYVKATYAEVAKATLGAAIAALIDAELRAIREFEEDCHREYPAVVKHD